MNELLLNKDYDGILESNDPKLVSKINYLYYIHQSDEIIRKTMDICFGKVDYENDLKFLNCAIYSDKPIVFKILDEKKFNYDKVDFLKKAELNNSIKCIDYFNTVI